MKNFDLTNFTKKRIIGFWSLGNAGKTMRIAKRAFTSVVLLLAFCTVVSCSDDEGKTPDDTQNQENALNDNAFIVDELSVVSASENSIVLKKSDEGATYSIGDIVISPPCENAPYGFMRKVVNVTVDGANMVLSTEQASLNEAFKELHIDQTFDGSFDMSEQGRTTGEGEGSVSFDFYENTTLVPGLKINGKVKANFSSMRFKYDKSRNSLLPSYVLLKADMNTNGSTLEISTNGATAVSTPEVIYASYSLPDFYINIPIGMFILPIRCAQKVDIKGGPLSINGKAKWNILPAVNAVMGVEYKNGAWQSLNSLSIDASASPLLQANFNPQLSMNASFTMLNPVYELSPYATDLIKFKCEAPATLSYTGQLQSPQYSLKFNLDINASLTADFWDGVSGEASYSVPIIEKTLKEGNWDLLSGNWTMITYDNGIAVGDYTFTYNQNCPAIWDYKESESGSFSFDGTNFTYIWDNHVVMPNFNYNPSTCEVYSDGPDTYWDDQETGGGTYSYDGTQYKLEYSNSSEINMVQFITPDRIKIYDQEFVRQP